MYKNRNCGKLMDISETGCDIKYFILGVIFFNEC